MGGGKIAVQKFAYVEKKHYLCTRFWNNFCIVRVGIRVLLVWLV